MKAFIVHLIWETFATESVYQSEGVNTSDFMCLYILRICNITHDEDWLQHQTASCLLPLFKRCLLWIWSCLGQSDQVFYIEKCVTCVHIINEIILWQGPDSNTGNIGELSWLWKTTQSKFKESEAPTRWRTMSLKLYLAAKPHVQEDICRRRSWNFP